MKRTLLILLALGILIPTFCQIFHKNEGLSQSIGTVNNGQLINGYKLPYKGEGFRYFSAINYYVMGRAFVHSDIHRIVLDSFEELHQEYPDYTFRIMECSRKKGGRPFPHHTHQNGTSIDFMTPLKKNGKAISRWDNIGMWRYAMKFDERGKSRINKKVEIDFDKLAHQILVLEQHAHKNGYRIKKVILETNLKDEIFASKHGALLEKSDIYFVRSLPKRINELHDDHVHIDFVKL